MNVSLPNTSGVTVGTGGTLNAQGSIATAGDLTSSGTVSLFDGTINTLSVGGGLNLSGSNLNLELGNSGAVGTNDSISVAGAASISGSNTINLSVIAGQTVVASVGGTQYTLITAPSGGLGSGFTLGTTPAGFFQLSLTNSTSNAEVLTITGNPTPPIAYWTGLASTGNGDANNYWGFGAALATPQSNWSITSNGQNDPLQVPGSNTTSSSPPPTPRQAPLAHSRPRWTPAIRSTA